MVNVVAGGGAGGGTISQSHQQSQNQSTNQSFGSQQSQSYIPDYSQTPILQSIAQYAQSMAPQVYDWGMAQWSKNQGNIDEMMRAAQTYASPQRIANEMGMAEAGVMQGAETGRQSAIRDLESYGIDPSSGRYQQLDNASRVMAGAAAAGAGNQQRMATEAQGNAMQQQALSAGMQNTALGYGASDAMNKLLSTGMQLKYSPLGTTSEGTSGTTGQSTGFSQSESASGPANMFAEGGDVPMELSDDSATTGGFVSHDLSPSAGSQIDDVDARLNAGEFVIPKDVVEWKGKEFFYKLMAAARKLRATSGGENGGMGYQEEPQGGEEQPTGYAGGGAVCDSPGADWRTCARDSGRDTLWGALATSGQPPSMEGKKVSGYAGGGDVIGRLPDKERVYGNVPDQQRRNPAAYGLPSVQYAGGGVVGAPYRTVYRPGGWGGLEDFAENLELRGKGYAGGGDVGPASPEMLKYAYYGADYHPSQYASRGRKYAGGGPVRNRGA